jgi:hypothetical protein
MTRSWSTCHRPPRRGSRGKEGPLTNS